MMKQTTMFDYINQTDAVLSSILEQRAEIFQEFIAYYRESPIDQVYLIGSGTSMHAGIAVKGFLEDVLKVKVIPMFPVPFTDQETIFNPNTMVIGISQSGGSMSTILALDKAQKQGLKTVAIVGEKDKEIVHHAAMSILMDIGEEKAVAKTKGYCATLLMLFLLGLELAKASNRIDEQQYEDYMIRIKKTIANIPFVVEKSVEWFHTMEADLVGSERIMVLGYDNHVGTILEGALKLLETVRVAVSGYELEEYMHGPYNSVKPDTRIFYLATSGQYLQRMQLLKNYMDHTTPYNYLITNTETVDTSKHLLIPFVDDQYFSVLEYVIPFQVLSYFLSIKKGIDPSVASDPNFHRNMKSKLV